MYKMSFILRTVILHRMPTFIGQVLHILPWIVHSPFHIFLHLNHLSLSYHFLHLTLYQFPPPHIIFTHFVLSRVKVSRISSFRFPLRVVSEKPAMLKRRSLEEDAGIAKICFAKTVSLGRVFEGFFLQIRTLILRTLWELPVNLNIFFGCLLPTWTHVKSLGESVGLLHQ